MTDRELVVFSDLIARVVTDADPAEALKLLEPLYNAPVNGAAIIVAITAAIGPQVKRIKALEARPDVKFEGAWKHDTPYRAGSCVVYDGSLFIATRQTVEPPNESGRGWALAARKGRDGKDLR
jgi:hypothetical protein